MEKYKKYEQFENNLRVVNNWLSNKENVDSQSHNRYSLHNIVFSAEYCGQAYAGANNYHASPEILNKYMSKVIKKRFLELTEEAVSLLEQDSMSLLIEAETELKEIQEKINLAKESMVK